MSLMAKRPGKYRQVFSRAAIIPEAPRRTVRFAVPTTPDMLLARHFSTKSASGLPTDTEPVLRNRLSYQMIRFDT